jgi:hypothetical protein
LITELIEEPVERKKERKKDRLVPIATNAHLQKTNQSKERKID